MTKVVLTKKAQEEQSIPEGWIMSSIDSIADIFGGGTPNTFNSSYWGGEIPWLSVVDFNNALRFVYDTEKKITELGLKESNTQLLKKGQIIISARGTVGAIAQLGKDMTFNQSCYGLAGKDNISNDFLFYSLKNVISDLKQKSHGAVFDTITRSTFKNVDIAMPVDPKERDQIVEILSSLDERIELNYNINSNLEAMANSLFKNLFLNVENELPVGWKIIPLDETASFLNGLALQKYPPEDGEHLPVIKIRELNNGVTDTTDKASTKVPPQYVIKDGDVIFSWSGSLEVVIWCGGPGALNQHLFKVTSEKYPKWFYYFWIKHFLPTFRNIAADKAVTMGHIKRGHLTEAKVIIPDDDTLLKMDELLSPIMEIIIANSIQINKLKETRDFLLPRLMSGKIRV